jgi:D-beta-D-heptose 7-phosphate kinase/D-beta-D-heptose 1-phosphate adenosyltransferase
MSVHVPDFSRSRLLVAGDVMLDRYWTGATSRISPEAPVPVVRVGRDESRPGGAANVALNLSSLGSQVQLLGVVGCDDAADTLREQLAAAHIGAEWITSAGLPTITKLRVLSRNQQVIRLDFEESFAAADAFDRRALNAAFARGLENADVAVLSDYAKGTLADVGGLVAAGH